MSKASEKAADRAETKAVEQLAGLDPEEYIDALETVIDALRDRLAAARDDLTRDAR